MNYAFSLAKNQILQGFSGDTADNLSSAGSILSEDFCHKVLGKPCENYKNAVKKLNKSTSAKKVLVDVKRIVAVYHLIEETTNPFVTEKEYKDSTASQQSIVQNGGEQNFMSIGSNESGLQKEVSQSDFLRLGDHSELKQNSNDQATSSSIQPNRPQSQTRAESDKKISQDTAEPVEPQSKPQKAIQRNSKEEEEIPLSGERRLSKEQHESSSRSKERAESDKKNSQGTTEPVKHQSKSQKATQRNSKEEEEIPLSGKRRLSIEQHESSSRSKERKTSGPKNCLRQFSNISKQNKFSNTDYQVRLCFCDEDSQTSPACMDTNCPELNGMDSYPVRDTIPIRERPQFADKTLQTGADGEQYRAQNEADFMHKGINTNNTNSFNVQVTEFTSSKVQTSNTGYPVQMCYSPGQDTCRCNRAHNHRRHNPKETPNKYLEHPLEHVFYSRSRKSKQKEIYKDTSEEICNCCCCHQIDRKLDDRYPSENYHHHPTRQEHKNPNYRDKVAIKPCTGQCRKWVNPDRQPPNKSSYYRPPPVPPAYDVSSSDYDEDEEFELLTDQGEDDNNFSSDNSIDKYVELPYQNSEEYEDLVQELEESLQIRSRNRVQRALTEFEKRSKYNKPLEKPIIDYEEHSDSEESLMRKISELTEKRKLLHKPIPCKGKPCCTYLAGKEKDGKNNQERPSKLKSASPRLHSTRKPHMMKPHTMKTRWQQDKETGEWFKVCPQVSKRITNLPHSKIDDHGCGCTCTCGGR